MWDTASWHISQIAYVSYKVYSTMNPSGIEYTTVINFVCSFYMSIWEDICSQMYIRVLEWCLMGNAQL